MRILFYRKTEKITYIIQIFFFFVYQYMVLPQLEIIRCDGLMSKNHQKEK